MGVELSPEKNVKKYQKHWRCETCLTWHEEINASALLQGVVREAFQPAVVGGVDFKKFQRSFVGEVAFSIDGVVFFDVLRRRHHFRLDYGKNGGVEGDLEILFLQLRDSVRCV